MGKKSKKGVSRTTTKKHQHHAAGHGKSSSNKALSSGRPNGSQISSCDNSLDSSSVVFQNSMKTAPTNNTSVAVTPMPVVHVKEQLLPPTQQRRLTEDELRAMIINNIARQRSINDKENKSSGSAVPSVTVLSAKQPTMLTLNLNDSTIDDVVEVKVPRTELPSVPAPTVETAQNVTACESTQPPVGTANLDTKVNSTLVENSTTAVMESATTIIDTAVTSTPSAAENDLVLASVNPEVPKETDQSPEDTSSDVTPFVPVQDETAVESNEPEPTAVDPQQKHIWSNTLRSIVSTDEDEEVLADTSISNKAVMDVTPLKNSKVLVPIIQTVSPSPEHATKQNSSNKNLSYLNGEEPVPSLDTPDKKDLDSNVKQDLCGCSIM